MTRGSKESERATLPKIQICGFRESICAVATAATPVAPAAVTATSAATTGTGAATAAATPPPCWTRETSTGSWRGKVQTIKCVLRTLPGNVRTFPLAIDRWRGRRESSLTFASFAPSSFAHHFGRQNKASSNRFDPTPNPHHLSVSHLHRRQSGIRRSWFLELLIDARRSSI